MRRRKDFKARSRQENPLSSEAEHQPFHNHEVSSKTAKCTKVLVTTGLFMYLFVPCVMIVMPQISEQVLYMNYFVSKAEVLSLNHPSSMHQLKFTASFKVSCDGFQLGVWHVLPSNASGGYEDDMVLPEESVRSYLQNAENIIVYHHGSGSTRATGERMQRRGIYKVFQKEGYHTIAFDYRGFGDSTGWPSERGVVNDSICIHDWIRKNTPETSKIFFWGHSMGGAVATLATTELKDRCKGDKRHCLQISGLILEGTLMNVRDGAKDNRIVRVVKKAYPEAFFDFLVDISMGDTKLATDENLHEVQSSVLILHAEDDDIIPVTHGEELFRLCKEKMPDVERKVKFIMFHASHRYGHMDLFRAPELPQILNGFISGNLQVNQQHMLEY